MSRATSEAKIVALLAEVSHDWPPEQVYPDRCTLSLAYGVWCGAYQAMFTLQTKRPGEKALDALAVAAEEVDRLHELIMDEGV